MDFIKDGFEAIQGSIVEYGLQVILCILMLVIGLKVIKFIVNRVQKTMEKKNIEPTIVQFTASMLRMVLKIALILTVLTTVGVAVTSFVAILAAASFALGMALQGTLSNFAAGIIILLLRPFKVGDFVEVAGQTGTVSSIQVFSTVLKTPDNKTIIIPNGGIIGTNVVNYSIEPERRVDFTFGVDYSADIKEVKTLLQKVSNDHEKVLKDKDVFVGLSELGDSSVNFVLRVWVKAEDYWAVYFDLMETVKVKLDEANISIPYPHIQIVKD